MKKVASVAQYFASVPPKSRKTLNELRKTIKGVVPQATEVIYYQMPSFRDTRPLVAYGAFSDHCSLFPLSAAVVERFKHQLKGYTATRGTIHFPLDKPIPASLVKKIVKARIVQNRDRSPRKVRGVQ